jgi:3',5'-cyclic AMP phosphodiesterase CpdA
VSARPILIAQISDLHIKRPGELAYGRVDTAAALTRCVDALNRFEPQPDLVVISGDLVDTPSVSAYGHLKRLLTPLHIPVAAIPGNHDGRGMLRDVWPDRHHAQRDGALNSTCSIGDLDIVLIDSSVPGAPHGMLDEKTLTWLDAALGASATRPALLFLHHPPFTTGITHMDAQNLRNAGDLAAILRRHQRARLVAAGHVHRSTLTTFAGIAATICPAPNHAVALDLDGHLPSSFKVEPPAFHLHAWFPGENFGSVVTHWVPIGDFDGPHPFRDGSGRLL